MAIESESKSKMIKDLKKVIETERNCKVLRVTRLAKASMNHVLRIDTNQGIIVARVFRKKNFPDCKMLVRIDATLKKHKIETSNILFCTQASKLFRYGFMLSTYIEGQDGWGAMRSGDITLSEYFVKLGKLLKRIHSIKLEETGTLKITALKNDFGWFEEPFASFKLKVSFPDKTYLQIGQFITKTLSKFSPRFRNVFCHCDLGPQNTIYTKDGRIIPIDWDLAESGSIFRDLSPITMGVKEMDNFGERSEVIGVIQESLFKGYGKTGFSKTETQQLLDAHHLISLIFNALACKNSPKDKRHLRSIKKEIEAILRNNHKDER